MSTVPTIHSDPMRHCCCFFFQIIPGLLVKLLYSKTPRHNIWCHISLAKLYASEEMLGKDQTFLPPPIPN